MLRAGNAPPPNLIHDHVNSVIVIKWLSKEKKREKGACDTCICMCRNICVFSIWISSVRFDSRGSHSKVQREWLRREYRRMNNNNNCERGKYIYYSFYIQCIPAALRSSAARSEWSAVKRQQWKCTPTVRGRTAVRHTIRNTEPLDALAQLIYKYFIVFFFGFNFFRAFFHLLFGIAVSLTPALTNSHWRTHVAATSIWERYTRSHCNKKK